MITVIPYMGLGNRIRCIRSAIRLANAKKTSLKIIWINDEVCPCDFCELFKEIQGAKYGIKIKNYKLRNRRYWLLNRDLKGFFKLLYYIFFILCAGIFNFERWSLDEANPMVQRWQI